MTKRLEALVLLTSLVVLAGASSAPAAVPRGFFGVTYDRDIAFAPAPVQAAQFAAMANSRVQTVRVLFSWALAQPGAMDPVGFEDSDRLVIRATRRNLIALPCVIYAPAWARIDPFSGVSPPRRPSEYAAYLKALVGRYGPSGSFWPAHPDLVKRPIRDWQIWNEPSLKFQWDAPNWQRGYGALVRAARPALKAADPGSRTVLAGLPNKSWEELASLYKRGGIRGAFDVASMHVYTSTPNYVLRLARLVRAVMARNGDRTKPAWMTELGLPAAKGRTNSKNSLQTTDGGMARFLRDTYVKLAGPGQRAEANVGRVYWYTWASDYRGREIFAYSGLNRYAGGRPAKRPALAYYRSVARRLGA